MYKNMPQNKRLNENTDQEANENKDQVVIKNRHDGVSEENVPQIKKNY